LTRPNKSKKIHLSTEKIDSFQKRIKKYYQENARDLPWRKTFNPYHILVSEIMLQQTQVERVIEKYKQFIRKFPDFFSLAAAPLSSILKQWQGLGYNRRAVSLKRTAQIIVKEFHGRLPSSLDRLQKLPGIGKTSASAIIAFAFNQPVVFIETNIRRVYIHSFFQHKERVHDKDILPLIDKTLVGSNPRQWYYALMDYGTMLKKQPFNPNRKSIHYQKQTPFAGSTRQLRGLILKHVLSQPYITKSSIMRESGRPREKVTEVLDKLCREGFMTKKGKRFSIT
jgi:A/G-specific adenine glycosylase